MFMDVERDKNTSSLILFTENAGIVYKIDINDTSIKPESAGIIHGNFDTEKIISQDIETSEPLFMDIKINGEIYQISKSK